MEKATERRYLRVVVAVFVVVGALGLLIVVGSLLLGDAVAGVFDALDVDAGSGLFSAPVIGSGLCVFGFGAALVMAATGSGAAAAGVAGAAAGVATGAGALALTRALVRMPTDPPVRLADLVGKTGTVVTRIPDGGLGEVAVPHLGHRLKLNARAAGPVPAGTAVVVAAATSATSVLVEPEETFFGPSSPQPGAP